MANRPSFHGPHSSDTLLINIDNAPKSSSAPQPTASTKLDHNRSVVSPIAALFQKFRKSQMDHTEEASPPSTYNPTDPRSSPASTVIADKTNYFQPQPSQKKPSTQKWIIAVLMVTFGSLIGISFILIGLGKALGTRKVANQQASLTNASVANASIQSSTRISTVITTMTV
ncbi:hypothetical protein DFQ28_006611 [Apophysomyces sp. BC1034]|nr:hypothetical protein DFQ30_003376 [Apophysomyces sp. BC1015]KAG0194762.1 hypothetical protein DFQ28_006611 [Apophysomyces sp. BC1034]